ncbi:LysR family transcriptional regulator [Rhodopseudomonas sp. AAP120]|uniref:LysR family transcriptional regulator n=1 Tax=Rhodopseudomonas sp. AAP120 TaxID=1523430 RepID=UPI0006B8873A|nr:LysR family transcriptional regulator [Rhodopseudomonas sp. AAP120]KPF90372.1 LysR family transcriptional regulator [Rhodopseudomonas sp. AAP120]
MDISTRQIRAFVAVAQLRSFTRAASLLHLSQPALTVQIHKLEALLAVRLLDRNSRTVELTRIGRELLPGFQRILRELDAVIVDTRALAQQKHGVVRIAALPSFAAGLLPELISKFHSARPGMSFVVKDVIASRVCASVLAEVVDLGITGGDDLADDFEVICRSRDQMLVIFPAQHPFSRKRRITLQDLAAQPLVLMDSETSVRAIVDSAFASAGLVAAPACEATYMMTAVGMVKAGLGVTVLPASAKEIKAEPSLKSRPIDDPSFERSIAVIKKKSRTLPPAAALFLGEIQAALA